MQIRYTSKAKKAIDQASKMSKSLHHHYIGTEHILIGLLKEGTGVAAQVLNDNGVELDKVMQLIEELIAPDAQVLTAEEPKTYQTQYDDTKPSSYQKVIQQGKAGQKKSTIRITRINGEVTEEKEVDKEIIQEAVPEIIVKGTQ